MHTLSLPLKKPVLFAHSHKAVMYALLSVGQKSAGVVQEKVDCNQNELDLSSF